MFDRKGVGERLFDVLIAIATFEECRGMATGQIDGTNHRSVMRKLFLDHPRSLGMSWGSHAAGAVKIGGELIGAGLAAIVHALVPGWFTETAGKTVSRIYGHIQQRKASAADPDQWPDYEI